MLFAALCVDSFLKGSEFGGDGFTDYQDSVISDRPKASANHVINADATQTNGMFFVFHMFGRLSGSPSTFCVAADMVSAQISTPSISVSNSGHFGLSPTARPPCTVTTTATAACFFQLQEDVNSDVRLLESSESLTVLSRPSYRNYPSPVSE